MKCIVTGAAGFIGSHLCEQLLAEGHDVLGIDGFIPYYPRTRKEANLVQAKRHVRFSFAEADLRRDALEPLVAGADYVFHLAAMPGLNQSWIDFEGYSGCNLLASQRLVEAIRHAAPRLQRLIHVSTSSVYGKYASGDESLPTRPISPYGVTKLAAEHLCHAYATAHNLPLVVLRYFSVYGPRQRPDMGYHRFIAALLTDEPINVYGDGQQIRGNTFITDGVAATVAAMQATPGETYNVGGGELATVWDILRLLEKITGRKARAQQIPERPGDQRYTFADTSKLQRHVGWKPHVALEKGLAAQVEWQRSLTKGP